MAIAPNRTGNRILDRLPSDESSRLLSSSQAVSLPNGRVIIQQDGPMPHVYFPTEGMLGIVIVLEDGGWVEGTTVGNEGMVGLPLFLGVEFQPLLVVSQVPGESLQVPAVTFMEVSRPGSALDRLIRRYILYRLRSAIQVGACNTLHSAEERMCRWLLMAHDRAGEDEFLITHEFLSELLGIRRQTVSIVAGTLQRAGLISYRRGLLRVLDREGLESASCECYATLNQLYNRILT